MTYPVARREALRRLALGGAGAVAVPGWAEALSVFAEEHAHGAQRTAAKPAAAWKPRVFTPAQDQAVIALSERIIPQTDTPGAKTAKVNEFIDSVLAEAPAAQRAGFLSGLAWVDARAQRDFGTPFAGASPAEQTSLLTALSATGAAEGEDKVGAEFFLAIKSMTITGFFTSEVGMRAELGDDGSMFFAEFKGCTHPEHLK